MKWKPPESHAIEEAGEVPKAFVVLKAEATPESIMEWVAERGFGDRAEVRRFEIAAALNRLRTLRIL